MRYLVAPNNIFSHYVTTAGNVRWDNTHFCPAGKLTPEEATYFWVFPLTLVDAPSFDPATQKREEAPAVLTGGVWYQGWAVIDLAGEELVAADAQANASELSQLENNDKVLFRLQMALIKTLLAKGVITAADFTATEIAKYQQAQTLKGKLWQ